MCVCMYVGSDQKMQETVRVCVCVCVRAPTCVCVQVLIIICRRRLGGRGVCV